MFEKTLLSHLKKIAPYIPGASIKQIQKNLNITSLIKLASNENPAGCSDAVIKKIQNINFSSLSSYPESNPFELINSLVKFHDNKFNAQQIIIGNGSNEVLELITRAAVSSEDNVIISEYGFLVYELSATIIGAKVKKIQETNYQTNLDAVRNAIDDKTKIIFLANPNNPTGSCFTKQAWENFISKVPTNIIVVLDEAYIEYFAHHDNLDSFDGMDYLQKFPNLALSRTFSKAYGLAGLRLGYLVAHASIINSMHKIREPFNLNALAQIAGVAAIEDQAFIKNHLDENLAVQKELEIFLQKKSIEYIDSYANFITIKLTGGGLNVADFYDAMLREGIILRTLANYNMPEHIRISLSSRSDNQKLMTAINKLI